MDGKNQGSFNWLRLEPPSWWYAERIPPAAWGLLPVSALYGAFVQKRFREASPLLDESRRIYSGLPGWGPKHRQTLRAQEYLTKARAGAS